MTDLPLVSFAVPAYNHARYIRECLDNIASEPYPNKELIVIDDGSTDDTLAVIRGWIAENNPSFPIELISRENRGLTRTLNELVQRARGQYFRPSASDDYPLPGTIVPMLQALDRHPEKKMVFGDAIVIDPNGLKIGDSVTFEHYRGRKQNYFTDAGLCMEAIKRWSLAGPVQMMRMEMFQQIGTYDETLKIEDWDMMLRMVARDLALFLDIKVAAYRLHPANSFKTLNANHELASAEEYLRILEKNHTLFSGGGRRELDYRLLKQRKYVSHLRRGRKPSKLVMFGIRTACRWRLLFGPVP